MWHHSVAVNTAPLLRLTKPHKRTKARPPDLHISSLARTPPRLTIPGTPLVCYKPMDLTPIIARLTSSVFWDKKIRIAILALASYIAMC